MARSRYNLIPAPIWPYLGPAFKGIDQDLSALESSGGGGTGGGVSSWNDLTDKPTLATVATSGSYADLTGTPTIPSAPGDIGAAPATHDHTAADIDSRAATDGHVLTADGAGGAAWEPPPAGGGGAGLAIGLGLPPLVGEYYPVLALGGHANFALAAGRSTPSPAWLEQAGSVDAVGVRLETGAADAVIEVGLYAWGLTATRIAILATIDASTAGLKVATFEPIALPAGRYVVVLRASHAVTVWGQTQGLISTQRGPNAGTGTWSLPHSTAGLLPEFTWTVVDSGIIGNTVPRAMLRRSA